MKNKLLLVGVACFSFLVASCGEDTTTTTTDVTNTGTTDVTNTGTTDVTDTTTSNLDVEETVFQEVFSAMGLNYTLTFEDDYGTGYAKVTEGGTYNSYYYEDLGEQFASLALYEGNYYFYRITSETSVEVDLSDAVSNEEYVGFYDATNAFAYADFSFDGVNGSVYTYSTTVEHPTMLLGDLTCWGYDEAYELTIKINEATGKVAGHLYDSDYDEIFVEFEFTNIGETVIGEFANVSEYLPEFIDDETAAEIEAAMINLGTNYTLESDYDYCDYYTDTAIYFGYFEYGVFVGNDNYIYIYDYLNGFMEDVVKYEDGDGTHTGEDLVYFNAFYVLSKYLDGSLFEVTDTEDVYVTTDDLNVYIFAAMLGWVGYADAVMIELTDDAFNFALFAGGMLLEEIEITNVGTTTIPWVDAYLA